MTGIYYRRPWRHDLGFDEGRRGDTRRTDLGPRDKFSHPAASPVVDEVHEMDAHAQCVERRVGVDPKFVKRSCGEEHAAPRACQARDRQPKLSRVRNCRVR